MASRKLGLLPLRATLGLIVAGAIAAAGCTESSVTPPIVTPTATATSTATAAPTATPTATAAATATPAPTATPTATASPNLLSVSGSPVLFTSTGYTLTFVANELLYAGAIAATSSDCTGIATFSPASAVGPAATFSVVSVAAGACHITVTDAAGQTATATIDVTTLTGTIQGHPKQ